MDETTFIFPANNLFQIKIKANEVLEAKTTCGALIIHENVGKASIMSENLKCTRNIENKAKIILEILNI
jgi:hypothetical protein